jgi:hypothetical protein
MSRKAEIIRSSLFIFISSSSSPLVFWILTLHPALAFKVSLNQASDLFALPSCLEKATTHQSSTSPPTRGLHTCLPTVLYKKADAIRYFIIPSTRYRTQNVTRKNKNKRVAHTSRGREKEREKRNHFRLFCL